MSHPYSIEPEAFEFERKFFVPKIPSIAFAELSVSLIVQNYIAAHEGTCIRVRMTAELQSGELQLHENGNQYSETDLLDLYHDRFTFSSVGVKSPPIGGVRYEKEMQIDVDVARSLMTTKGALVAKQRYGFFLSGDGWNLDVFGGSNYPLLVAECERSGPVTNLDVPKFCTKEVTNELRFTNDSLAYSPFSSWSDKFYRELEMRAG
ncbi:hypothetical protein [Paenarthrobacter nitroguajacolicus]|uniref:hypothetical protein n=1 Tax=Paenarthrobacter nitroguajacolicus TaxID=211146 RepID=UPI00405433E5